MFQKKAGSGNIDIGDIWDGFVALWSRKYKSVFFTIFLGVCVWGGFLWYYSLYYFQWSPEQKQSYIASQSRRTVFNQAGFEKVLRVLDTRESVYRSESASLKNVFATDKKAK